MVKKNWSVLNATVDIFQKCLKMKNCLLNNTSSYLMNTLASREKTAYFLRCLYINKEHWTLNIYEYNKSRFIWHFNPIESFLLGPSWGSYRSLSLWFFFFSQNSWCRTYYSLFQNIFEQLLCAGRDSRDTKTDLVD